MVAMVAAASMPDMKAAASSSSLSVTSGNTTAAAARQSAVQRANRSTVRVSGTSQTAALNDVWLLPMSTYTISSPFGDAGLGSGVDLAAPEGTPFYAAHSGTVTLARWDGAYGYTVVVNAGNGVQLVYGHASRLLVQEGQKVNSGDLLALTGDTGYAMAGPSVRFEVRVNGHATNPIAFLLDQGGVNLTKHKDSLS